MSLSTIAPWFAAALVVVAATGGIGANLRPIPANDISKTAGSIPAPPRRRDFLILLALFATFAIYGSLVPFQFRSLDLVEALQSFSQLLRRNLSIDSRSDWLANVLLAVPLGFCGSAALGVDGKGVASRMWQAALVVLLTVCFSAGLEFSQLWVPARTCSQNDIAAQTIGAIIGTSLWMAAGQSLTNWARGFFSDHESHRPIDKLLLAYIGVLLIYSVLPLDLTISPAELYHKFRDGKVVLQPLTGKEFSPEKISDTLGIALLFATVGMLSASRQSGLMQQHPVVRATLWGGCLSICIEIVQLFVSSRYTKLSDIVVGASAAALGGWFSVFASRQSKPACNHPAVDRQHAWSWFLLAAMYAVCLVILFSAPFDWLHDSVRIAKRWRNLWNIPFGYSKYWSDPLEALSDVMLKLLLFGSLGALLARGLAPAWISPSRRRICHILAVLACSALAMTIEMLQVYLPPRVPDLTDVLLAAAGAWLGIVATALVVLRSSRNRSVKPLKTVRFQLTELVVCDPESREKSDSSQTS